MIVDVLIKAVVKVLTGIFGLLPAYNLPSSVTDLGTGIGAALASANGLFPVTVLGGCIAIVLAARLFLAVWAGIVWLYTKIPAKFT